MEASDTILDITTYKLASRWVSHAKINMLHRELHKDLDIEKASERKQKWSKEDSMKFEIIRSIIEYQVKEDSAAK